MNPDLTVSNVPQHEAFRNGQRITHVAEDPSAMVLARGHKVRVFGFESDSREGRLNGSLGRVERAYERHEIDEPSKSAADDDDVDASGQWACKTCTLLNDPSNTSCGVCGTPRPPPKSYLRSGKAEYKWQFEGGTARGSGQWMDYLPVDSTVLENAFQAKSSTTTVTNRFGTYDITFVFEKSPTSAFGSGTQKSKANQYVRSIRRVTKYGSLPFPPDKDIAAADVVLDDGETLRKIDVGHLRILPEPIPVDDKKAWDAFDARCVMTFKLHFADIFDDTFERYKRHARRPTRMEAAKLFGGGLSRSSKYGFSTKDEDAVSKDEAVQLSRIAIWSRKTKRRERAARVVGAATKAAREDDGTEGEGYYRYFRLFTTGRNHVTFAKNYTFSIDAFELFGTLRARSFKPKEIGSVSNVGKDRTEYATGFFVVDEGFSPLGENATIRSMRALSLTNSRDVNVVRGGSAGAGYSMVGMQLARVNGHGDRLGLVNGSNVVAVDGTAVRSYEDYKRLALMKKSFRITLNEPFVVVGRSSKIKPYGFTVDAKTMRIDRATADVQRAGIRIGLEIVAIEDELVDCPSGFSMDVDGRYANLMGILNKYKKRRKCSLKIKLLRNFCGELRLRSSKLKVRTRGSFSPFVRTRFDARSLTLVRSLARSTFILRRSGKRTNRRRITRPWTQQNCSLCGS